MNAILVWANENQGVLALLALIVGAPTLLIFMFKGYRHFFPSRIELERRIKNEFAHAASLKEEVESRAKWDEDFSYYGEFLLRDAARKLPETDEAHSSLITPHSIVVLSKIHTEYLEFTSGSNFQRHIIKMGDSWYFSSESEEGSIKVYTVMRIQYRDIVTIRWDTNDYWEWPQVCCRFPSSNRFPFSHIYYAREGDLDPRRFLSEICTISDVQPKPKEFS